MSVVIVVVSVILVSVEFRVCHVFGCVCVWGGGGGGGGGGWLTS